MDVVVVYVGSKDVGEHPWNSLLDAGNFAAFHISSTL